MIHLLKLIRNALLAVHPRVWLERAPRNAVVPYVVYLVPSSADAEIREDFVVEVTIWGRGPDTTALEQLTDDVDRAMQRLYYLDGNLSARLYRTGRLMLPDPDPHVRRRELRYLAKVHFLQA